MAQHGGTRRGAGRKAGSLNQRTREVAQRMTSEGGVSPLEIMVAIMRERWAAYQDTKDPSAAMVAVEAAKSAAAYLHPRLAPAEAPVRIPPPSGTPSRQAQQVLTSMAAGEITPDQAAKVIQAIAAQMRILEVDELERRVKALEEAKNG